MENSSKADARRRKMKKQLNKKLLILGGGSDMCSVTKLAQEMGCKVYITDYYDTLRSPAKKIADVSVDISISDIDSIVSYIKENHIDGVMTGFTDSYLEYYIKICEAAELPYYGSYDALGIATDKMQFKKACMESGVGVIPGINAYDLKTAKKFADLNGYPLIIKPVDNSGSRGVIRCNDERYFEQCFDYAISFSKTKNVIVEKYLDCESIACSYQLDGDKAVLSAICDRTVYQSKENGSAITHEARYPSKYIDRYIKEVDEPMKKMFREHGFVNGTVGIMGFVDEKAFYMCEMTYRPSGGHHYTLIKDQNGIDGLALLIEFAVNGNISGYHKELESPYFHEVCGMIHIVGKAGYVIAKMEGVEKISDMKEVLEVCQELRVGQTIGKDGTTAQTLVSVWLRARNWNEYDSLIKQIKDMLVVEDANGETLILEQ